MANILVVNPNSVLNNHLSVVASGVSESDAVAMREAEIDALMKEYKPGEVAREVLSAAIYNNVRYFRGELRATGINSCEWANEVAAIWASTLALLDGIWMQSNCR
jgi:hypothetical protein